MTTNFRLPGPTAVPQEILDVMRTPMIPHRGPKAIELVGSIIKRTKEIHQTEGDAIVLPASGSAGWEIAITNLLSPGDPVLSAQSGAFGERFAFVAKTFGLDVRTVVRPWGQAITPEILAEALNENPDVKAVLLTHNETSTGVTNPLPELAKIVRDHGALVLVDAVSSAAGIPLKVDEWGLDFVLSGSQKAWMCPPGLIIATVSTRALDAYKRSVFPKFFWDLESAVMTSRQGMTPTTPALTMLYAFDVALDMILSEGLENVWDRHRLLGEQTRAGIDEIGLELFADRAYASGTVTAVKAPEGMSAKKLIDHLEAKYDVIVGGGQGSYSDKIFRIGHMGWCHPADIDGCLDAIESAVKDLTE
jgi:aspartate aminotransferase-like enzyme